MYNRMLRLPNRAIGVIRKLQIIGARLDHVKGKHHCPVCGKNVAHFLELPRSYFTRFAQNQCIHSIHSFETLNTAQYSCPLCFTSDRNRLYALYLGEIFAQIDQTRRYRFVDFAPDKSLTRFIRSYSFIDYRSADLYMEDVDDRVDLTDMKIYPDESVDMFLCSHVLEHIVDDVQAMQELYRILKPSGFGIVMVPIHLDLHEILEDPSITIVADRWKYFAQDDHVRAYSKKGFISRLEHVGFHVAKHGIDYFGANAFIRSGIDVRSVLYVVRKKDLHL